MKYSYAHKDWPELTHAYGSAEDVPALLAQLNAPDKQTREAALGELFGNIWHQGTVYPASAKALRELIVLFKSPHCIDLESVAVLLASIADGEGFFHAHGGNWVGGIREIQEKTLAVRGSSIAAEMQKESEYLREIREMALEVIPLLLPFLDSPNATLRETIVGMLQRYSAHIPDACARLEQRLSVEGDEDVRRRVEEALAAIRRNGPNA